MRRYNGGPVTALPQGAAAGMAAVEVLHVPLAHLPHQIRAAVRARGCEQQVHMIRHQAISMHVACELPRELPEVKQVDQVVAAYAEACASIVTALDEVQRHAGDRSLDCRGMDTETSSGESVDRIGL